MNRADGGASGLRSPAAFAALVAIGLAAAAWFVARSPVFEVDRIAVRGTFHVDPDRIRGLAGVPSGANLLWLSLDRVARRVSTDPWIARAEASRDLPSTLVLEVSERRPSGWLADWGSAVVLAGDGVVLERLDSAPADLPALGRTTTELAPGDRVADPPAALRVAASMPDDLLSRTSGVVLRRGEAVAGLRGGGQVRYGELADLSEKHRAARSILQWAEREGIPIGVIDVSVPAAPTLRPRGTGRELVVPNGATPTATTTPSP